MPANPFLKSVVITLANTNYNLLTLMQALDGATYPRVAKLQLQLDPGAGAAKFFIGNDDLSGTNFGVSLVAGQALNFDSTPQNIIWLGGILLRSDTAGVRVNVVALAQ
jgi:hypothetical protein